MPPSRPAYDLPPAAPRSVVREDSIDYGFIGIHPIRNRLHRLEIHSLQTRDSIRIIEGKALTPDSTNLRVTASTQSP